MCETKILAAMAKRIIPPTTCALFPTQGPTRAPIRIANMHIAPVTMPLTALGYHTGTRNIAMLKPTASASMLVAMESNTRITPRVGSPASSTLAGFSPARIIRTATKARRARAIQWSNEETTGSTVSPSLQPTTGIRNWKSPKWNESLNAARLVVM